MQKKWFLGLLFCCFFVFLIISQTSKIATAEAFADVTLGTDVYCCSSADATLTACPTDFITCQTNRLSTLGFGSVQDAQNYDMDHNTNIYGDVQLACLNACTCFAKTVSSCLNATAPACTSWTYSVWGDCTGGKQTRTPVTYKPFGCTGGSPVLEKTCTTSVCSYNDDCSGSTYCLLVFDPLTGMINEGTCKNKKSSGASCDSSSECSGNSCLNGKCTSTCMFDHNCKDNQYCDTNTSPGTCVAKKSSGTCTSASQCSGGFCNSGACSSKAPSSCSPSCEAGKYCRTTPQPNLCVDQLDYDMNCSAPSQCISGFCVKGKCAVSATGTLCSSDSNCKGTEYCDTDINPSACASKKANGIACSTAKTCSSGFCNLDGQCAVPSTEVECDEDADCAAKQFCNTAINPKICADKRADGQTCNLATQCSGGLCNGNVCASKKANGKPCTAPTECISNYCPTAATRVCAVAPATACDPVCSQAQFCDTTAVPIACATKKDDGVICSDASQCKNNFCNSNVCGSVAVSGECPSFKTSGDCESHIGQCEWVSNTCSTKPGYGQECTIDATGFDNCRENEGQCIANNGKSICRKVCDDIGDCPGNSYCFNAGGGKFCQVKLAAGGACPEGNDACISGVCTANACVGGVAPPTTPPGGTTEPVEEYSIPNFLGVDDPNLVIGRIIKYIIGFAGTIALVTFMYGGTLWLISAGRPDYVDKGKNFMIWAAIGLVIVFSSYILVGQVFTLFGK
ncbi:MAG: hypothetical protein UT02_C0008G0002 [Parcubacteria group bacterium GW2011_GWC2_38_7]|nr:MAG: hypothetical protein UT02_C0008G0002 [Parcubacteria group bacterium GW2011_GWC2_38_7]